MNAATATKHHSTSKRTWHELIPGDLIFDVEGQPIGKVVDARKDSRRDQIWLELDWRVPFDHYRLIRNSLWENATCVRIEKRLVCSSPRPPVKKRS